MDERYLKQRQLNSNFSRRIKFPWNLQSRSYNWMYPFHTSAAISRYDKAWTKCHQLEWGKNVPEDSLQDSSSGKDCHSNVASSVVDWKCEGELFRRTAKKNELTGKRGNIFHYHPFPLLFRVFRKAFSVEVLCRQSHPTVAELRPRETTMVVIVALI